jgi:hypothetical protein
MKKVIIILSVFILITGGCSQAANKQIATNENTDDILTIVHNMDSVEIQNTNTKQLYDIQEIDSITYFSIKEVTNIPERNLEKITDLEQVKEMLKGIVVWGKCVEYGKDEENDYDYCVKMQEDEQGDEIYKIIFRNGRKIWYADDGYIPYTFLVYYPQEDILFLQPGQGDSPRGYESFNLTTGEEDVTEEPEYIFYSPSKQYRLNGYYAGNGNHVYFIQEKSETKYQTIFIEELSNFDQYDRKIIFDVFWQNDTILNFATYSGNDYYNRSNEYYQLTKIK